MQSTGVPVGKYSYNPNEILGKSSFGQVYKAYETDKPTETPLAVKKVSKTLLSDDASKNEKIKKELSVLKTIKSDGIVHIIDSVETKEFIYLFMNYCDGGSLKQKVERGNLVPEKEALKIVKQIADIFLNIDNADVVSVYGHDKALMHREIKHSHILFHQGTVKLASFGFAKVIDDIDATVREAHTSVEPNLFTAPQIIDYDEYCAKCDVWSTGLVLYYALFGKVPGAKTTPAKVCEEIKTNGLDFPSKIHPDTKDLIQKMVKFEEGERLSWIDVSEHPALENL